MNIWMRNIGWPSLDTGRSEVGSSLQYSLLKLTIRKYVLCGRTGKLHKVNKYGDSLTWVPSQFKELGDWTPRNPQTWRIPGTGFSSVGADILRREICPLQMACCSERRIKQIIEAWSNSWAQAQRYTFLLIPSLFPYRTWSSHPFLHPISLTPAPWTSRSPHRARTLWAAVFLVAYCSSTLNVQNSSALRTTVFMVLKSSNWYVWGRELVNQRLSEPGLSFFCEVTVNISTRCILGPMLVGFPRYHYNITVLLRIS